jgi:hypothetical protein
MPDVRRMIISPASIGTAGASPGAEADEAVDRAAPGHVVNTEASKMTERRDAD